MKDQNINEFTVSSHTEILGLNAISDFALHLSGHQAGIQRWPRLDLDSFSHGHSISAVMMCWRICASMKTKTDIFHTKWEMFFSLKWHFHSVSCSLCAFLFRQSVVSWGFSQRLIWKLLVTDKWLTSASANSLLYSLTVMPW